MQALHLNITVESELLGTLRDYYRTVPSLRCLQLQCSKLDDEWDEEELEQFYVSIRDHLDDRYTEFFKCHDGDIFVLSRVLTHKRTDALLTLLSPKLGSAFSSEGLAHLFELGVDWPVLEKICEAKLRAMEEQDTPHDEGARAPQIRMPDAAMIHTIASRRAERDAPEIMIVEDDAFSQKLVSNILNNRYAHTICGDGQGALFEYAKRAPDVLFLDIGLPDFSGMDILKHIFAIDPQAFVVMFSGNGDRDNVLKAVELGARGFVGKPFTQEKIFHYIEKSPFVEGKGALQV